ncbi:ABC transporter permease [Hyphomonas sp.]|uniref:ABC transporter permease n=1 Tax=Hyphomonas sp. TaxID=87 RepID=UPI0025BB7B90|nr:ABC transporter permease [Hyphomonas sp.]
MRNILLIFRRDYLGYVKAWGFWLSLAAVPLFMIIGAALATFAAQSSPVRYFAVVEPGSIYAEAIEAEFQRREQADAERASELVEQLDLPVPEESAPDTDPVDPASRKFIQVPAPATTIDGLRPYLLGERTVSGPLGDKPLFAAFILSEGGGELEYWSDDVNVDQLRYVAKSAMLRLARREALADAGLGEDFLKTVDAGAFDVPARRIRTVEEQDTTGAEVTMADRAPMFVAGGLAYFLWLMVFSIIQYLLMGTIEERSNKIFDTLLTSVKLPELLAGKLLAVFAVTSTMMLSWGLFAFAGGTIVSTQIPGVGNAIAPFMAALANPAIIVPGLISFLLGYIMYGMTFMALGSLCDTIQEAQTLLSPMMILLMLPMFAIFITFQDPGSPLVDIASWIPFFTPFLLILRMPQDPPLWEVLAQMGLMAAFALLILWLSTKVYRAGAVHGAGIGDMGGMLKRMIGLKGKAA